MKWTNCYSQGTIDRLSRTSQHPRSHYQRDFDRLIFSSSFRRLQAKTQVFPLPGSTFVHNRLTHSLEVASVGRSLGTIVGNFLANHKIDKNDTSGQEFYKYELPTVIASGCLAHDIGNPAFGHSGEKAISSYFINSASSGIGGQILKDYFDEWEWADLINFEGNANAFRVLTGQFKGKSEGGMGLTLATLASIIKYPCHSLAVNKDEKHTKKYCYFKTEERQFLQLVDEVGMISEQGNRVFKRHPYVYLVEAADDICYSIIDMEDAHRLNILSFEYLREILLQLLKEIDRPEEKFDRINQILDGLGDHNSAIAYLRAKVINALVMECGDIFMKHNEDIISGSFKGSLISEIKLRCPTIKTIEEVSVQKIYNHPSVIEIEIAGYNVMSELLELFVPAVLKPEVSALDRSILSLIPRQFQNFGDKDISPYTKVMSVLDHISAMTDTYATELYRKIKGIEIGKHK